MKITVLRKTFMEDLAKEYGTKGLDTKTWSSHLQLQRRPSSGNIQARSY